MDRTERRIVKAKGSHRGRKLLVLDTAHTLEMVRERGLEVPIVSRDLDGYFDHVWSVHPFATLLTSEEWGPRFGRPDSYDFASRHTVIEGKVGRHRALKHVFPLNFLLGQLDLLMHLHRLIRREKISAVRVTSPLYIGLFGWLLSRLSRIPLVIHVGGNHDKMFETTGLSQEPRLMRSRKVEKMVERFVFSRAELIAGANQDNLDFALANGAPADRTTLFRYGNLLHSAHLTDPAQRVGDDRYLGELGITRGQFLLYVGRLEPVKHPDHVVEVLARVRSRGFDVKAVLAGEGRMHGQLLDQARRLGVAESVIMPGNISQEHLADLFAAAGAVVSPHTGRALSEAAFAAAPVAAYDLDWQSELITDGVTGYLVPHEAVDRLADGVERLLRDPSGAARLGAALRAKAREMLDPERLNAHECAIFTQLLADQ